MPLCSCVFSALCKQTVQILKRGIKMHGVKVSLLFWHASSFSALRHQPDFSHSCKHLDRSNTFTSWSRQKKERSVGIKVYALVVILVVRDFQGKDEGSLNSKIWHRRLRRVWERWQLWNVPPTLAELHDRIESYCLTEEREIRWWANRWNKVGIFWMIAGEHVSKGKQEAERKARVTRPAAAQPCLLTLPLDKTPVSYIL